MNTEPFLLIAVTDPILHPEVAHIAAASTRPIVDLSDRLPARPDDPAAGTVADLIGRHLPRAVAVIVDKDTARLLGSARHHEHLFFVADDTEPVDWETALSVRADQAFLIPAQSAELLAALAALRDAATPALRTAPAGRPSPRAPGQTIAVTGTAGGVGTSTLAALLARHAARSGPTTLVDAVPHSGGLDLVMGIEDVAGARWPDLSLATGGSIDAASLQDALPEDPSEFGSYPPPAAPSPLLAPSRWKMFTWSLKHWRRGRGPPSLTCLRGRVGCSTVPLPPHWPAILTMLLSSRPPKYAPWPPWRNFFRC